MRGAKMLDPEKAYNGFAVDDVHKAKEFYEETLGLNASFVDRGQQLLQLELGGGTPTLVYTKPEIQSGHLHRPQLPGLGRGGNCRRAHRQGSHLRAIRRA